MAGKSARDKCFSEAIDEYNDWHEDKLPVDSQAPWGKVDGKWRPLSGFEKFWNWIKGGIPFRVPDWTAYIDGTPVAGDNKFEGDEFGKTKGKRTGQTQLQDQNEMNKQRSPGKTEYQDLHLNPEKCGCDENPQRKEVFDPMLAPMPMVAPNPTPGSVPELGPIEMPQMPEIPAFEFVFP